MKYIKDILLGIAAFGILVVFILLITHFENIHKDFKKKGYDIVDEVKLVTIEGDTVLLRHEGTPIYIYKKQKE